MHLNASKDVKSTLPVKISYAAVIELRIYLKKYLKF